MAGIKKSLQRRKDTKEVLNNSPYKDEAKKSYRKELGKTMMGVAPGIAGMAVANAVGSKKLDSAKTMKEIDRIGNKTYAGVAASGVASMAGNAAVAMHHAKQNRKSGFAQKQTEYFKKEMKNKGYSDKDIDKMHNRHVVKGIGSFNTAKRMKKSAELSESIDYILNKEAAAVVGIKAALSSLGKVLAKGGAKAGAKAGAAATKAGTTASKAGSSIASGAKTFGTKAKQGGKLVGAGLTGAAIASSMPAKQPDNSDMHRYAELSESVDYLLSKSAETDTDEEKRSKKKRALAIAGIVGTAALGAGLAYKNRKNISKSVAGAVQKVKNTPTSIKAYPAKFKSERKIVKKFAPGKASHETIKKNIGRYTEKSQAYNSAAMKAKIKAETTTGAASAKYKQQATQYKNTAKNLQDSATKKQDILNTAVKKDHIGNFKRGVKGVAGTAVESAAPSLALGAAGLAAQKAQHEYQKRNNQ